MTDAAGSFEEGLIRLLHERFPTVGVDVLRRYRSVLLPHLLRDDDKKPDFDKPGESGEGGTPHLIYTWREGEAGQKGRWEKTIARTFEECDTIIVEAAYRESGACPPPGGFAKMLSKAEDKARSVARKYPCTEDCGVT